MDPEIASKSDLCERFGPFLTRKFKILKKQNKSALVGMHLKHTKRIFVFNNRAAFVLVRKCIQPNLRGGGPSLALRMVYNLLW